MYKYLLQTPQPYRKYLDVYVDLLHLRTQQRDAPDYREHPAANEQGQGHPYQICDPTSCGVPDIRFLLQSSAVCGRFLQAFFGKPDSQELGFRWRADGNIFQKIFDGKVMDYLL